MIFKVDFVSPDGRLGAVSQSESIDHNLALGAGPTRLPLHRAEGVAQFERVCRLEDWLIVNIFKSTGQVIEQRFIHFLADPLLLGRWRWLNPELIEQWTAMQKGSGQYVHRDNVGITSSQGPEQVLDRDILLCLDEAWTSRQWQCLHECGLAGQVDREDMLIWGEGYEADRLGQITRCYYLFFRGSAVADSCPSGYLKSVQPMSQGKARQILYQCWQTLFFGK